MVKMLTWLEIYGCVVRPERMDVVAYSAPVTTVRLRVASEDASGMVIGMERSSNSRAVLRLTRDPTLLSDIEDLDARDTARRIAGEKILHLGAIVEWERVFNFNDDNASTLPGGCIIIPQPAPLMLTFRLTDRTIDWRPFTQGVDRDELSFKSMARSGCKIP